MMLRALWSVSRAVCPYVLKYCLRKCCTYSTYVWTVFLHFPLSAVLYIRMGCTITRYICLSPFCTALGRQVSLPTSPPARPPPPLALASPAPANPTNQDLAARAPIRPPLPKSVSLYTIKETLPLPRSRSPDGAASQRGKRSGSPSTARKYLSQSAGPANGLYELSGVSNEERKKFCTTIQRLRSQYLFSDSSSNPGFVFSPLFTDYHHSDNKIEVFISSEHTKDPVSFTCDVNTSVQHVLSQALCLVLDDPSQTSTDQYLLQVNGTPEYLHHDTVLAWYEHVQECIRHDRDVKFTLLQKSQANRELARTEEDDQLEFNIETFHQFLERPEVTFVSRNGIEILLEAFNKEVTKLVQSCQTSSGTVSVKGVEQAVKAICMTLSSLETNPITKSIQALRTASNSTMPLIIQSGLTPAVHQLIEMYGNVYGMNLQLSPESSEKKEIEVTSVKEHLKLHLASAHRLPEKIKNSYEYFVVSCVAYYGMKAVCPSTLHSKPVKLCPLPSLSADKKSSSSSSIFTDKIVWNQEVDLRVPLCRLPLETRLCLTLYGKNLPASDENQKVLGWVAIPLYNFNRVMVSGHYLLGLWSDVSPSPIGSCASNIYHPNSIILQVDLAPALKDRQVVFPLVEEEPVSRVMDIGSLDPTTLKQLEQIVSKDPLAKLTEGETQLLWAKRHYLHRLQQTTALPWVLSAAHSWDWTCLPDIHSLLDNWTTLQPVNALRLLHPLFPDQHVRAKAVSWIQHLSDDNLNDFLPQLVQALKYENHQDSALASFLIERGIQNIRVAHFLYWYLKDNIGDHQYSECYRTVLAALLGVCGQALRHQFSQQSALIAQLTRIARKVKNAKDHARHALVQQELESLDSSLVSNLRLPIDPSFHVQDLNLKACSYFTSFTVPLKLVFKNAEAGKQDMALMFKVGDDLRQDMLTLQMIRLMDKIWLSEGLDLKIVTFKCISTGNNIGLVELVGETETLRKIQVEHGVTGSFRSRPLNEWLQKHNPTKAQFEKVVRNFTYSCAGYCVATYVLGIGDRHNDNIMVKTSGHMFHIDFGKFLGNAQMFGNIKRDRTPFVLTSDMAYVINGGDKPSHKFQHFVDLCCKAFNIIRKHASLFLNLFGLMLSSGISELSNLEDIQYVHNALKPSATDAEATQMFTRLLEASLQGSRATQLNFFIHNLAQLRFTGNSNEDLFSFNPKKYSLTSDGRITAATVFGYQKRYNPEKHYVYIVKLSRQSGGGGETSSFVFRRYSEFQELWDKLCALFPGARFTPLSGAVIVGRTHIKQVAQRRQVEIQAFLREIFRMPPDIKDCDLVYTFFHPLLRDEKDEETSSITKSKAAHEQESKKSDSLNRSVSGELKLSLHYKEDALFIMVMHAKNLSWAESGMPDPYVKAYLHPDKDKFTKRKTKVAKNTLHPTYNEMIVYKISMDELSTKQLEMSVWNCDYFKENDFMGSVLIDLNSIDLKQETVKWYQLRSQLYQG